MPAWVDKLAWCLPVTSWLLVWDVTFRWDADNCQVVATLNFDASSVLGLDWRCDGQYLAIAGYQGVKIWHSQSGMTIHTFWMYLLQV